MVTGKLQLDELCRLQIYDRLQQPVIVLENQINITFNQEFFCDFIS